LLTSAVAASERVLVGFDFPYGYPAGFAYALVLSGASPAWRRTWAELGRLVTDTSGNRNNRFEVAEHLNERLGPELGPFWGCPAARRHLSQRRGSFPYSTRTGIELDEYRITEDRARRRRQLSSAWKLDFQPTVGSQVLLGIPRLASLRDDSVLAPVSRVWPFETGFSLESDRPRPSVLHCEIWPRVIDVEAASAPSGTLDEAQVIGLVQWASALDVAGGLDGLFAPKALTTAQAQACVAEEGWILGVV
jgi:precorrin-8X/cobalt-precorrin-8 methylmutase